MPFQDMINLHFTAAEVAQFNNLAGQMEALVQSKLRNLSEEENVRVGSISETNKLFVNKAQDYNEYQPALSSPDVDWVEFEADYFDRGFLENGSLRLMGLAKAMTETRRLHDYDNYENATIDRRYTDYKSKTQPGTGFDAKAAEYAKFFERESNSEPTNPNPIPPPSGPRP